MRYRISTVAVRLRNVWPMGAQECTLGRAAMSNGFPRDPDEYKNGASRGTLHRLGKIFVGNDGKACGGKKAYSDPVMGVTGATESVSICRKGPDPTR